MECNYPVLRQNMGVLLNMFEKHRNQKIQHCTSILEARRDRYVDRMYRKESNDCGFLRTYSIIHPYFALVQGSSF